MNRGDFRHLADRHGVAAGTVEKDYGLTGLLSVISRFPGLAKMVFKGGTSLKKVYFDDFGYSEDLDFVCFEDVTDDLAGFLVDGVAGLDVDFVGVTRPERYRDGARFRVMYNESTGVRAGIRVDLSLRGSVVLGHPALPVLGRYATIPGPFSVPVTALEETMAEKVDALIYSRHARHLHDVWDLHRRGVGIDPALVRQKTKSLHNEDYDLARLEKRLPEKAGNWDNDLTPFLPGRPPSFGRVSGEVLGLVAAAMG